MATPLATAEAPARFWEPPDQALLDAGREGELLVAKVRMALTFVLLAIPIADLSTAASEGRERYWIGFYVTLIAWAMSVGIFLFIRRDTTRRWIPVATSLFDVSFITMTLLLYGYMVGPVVLLNNRLSFDTYFLALGATCLRFDKRVALVAGLACMAQWTASTVVMVNTFPDAVRVADPIYGRWAWSELISRDILLATATALCVFIVRGIERQRKLSTSDALTGLHNRRFLDDWLRNELARVARRGGDLALAMLDVDHFKAFNDTHGHAAGDRALRHVSLLLANAVRRTDIVARYGGEEFVIVMPETTAAQAAAKLDAIRQTIESDPIVLSWAASGRVAARLTVSVGVGAWEPEMGESTGALIAAADRLLYQAKRTGRNRVETPALGMSALPDAPNHPSHH